LNDVLTTRCNLSSLLSLGTIWTEATNSRRRWT
jgi:hypothetical protein